MKVKDLENSLDAMESLIDNIKDIQEIKDLVGYYDFLKKNSGYFFSDDDPNDLIKMLDSFKGDIASIRQSIQDAIQDHGRELEL